MSSGGWPAGQAKAAERKINAHFIVGNALLMFAWKMTPSVNLFALYSGLPLVGLGSFAVQTSIGVAVWSVLLGVMASSTAAENEGKPTTISSVQVVRRTTTHHNMVFD